MVISSVQQVLEEAFYAFALKWLPDMLKAKRLDCSQAVELTKWPLLIKESKAQLQGSGAPYPYVHHLNESMNRLRTIAVHRSSTFVTVIAQLVTDAAAVADLLGDTERTASLRAVHVEIINATGIIRAERVAIKGRTDTKLAEIRQARGSTDKGLAGREELERKVVEEMLEEDVVFRRLAGQVLEENVGKALAKRGQAASSWYLGK